MAFKFENLDVWELAIQLSDEVYRISDQLPDSEKFNLYSQIRRASTSICLNIAEGSTGQSDPEQARFIGYAHRSLMEVVACLLLLKRRSYISEKAFISLYNDSEELAKKLSAFKNYLKRDSVNESEQDYNF